VSSAHRQLLSRDRAPTLEMLASSVRQRNEVTTPDERPASSLQQAGFAGIVAGTIGVDHSSSAICSTDANMTSFDFKMLTH
jgi:hypothetical protein